MLQQKAPCFLLFLFYSRYTELLKLSIHERRYKYAIDVFQQLELEVVGTSL